MDPAGFGIKKMFGRLCLILVLAGCNYVPPDSRPISDSEELVNIANFVADIAEAPARCRNWDQVGIYSAYDAEDFFSITGKTPDQLSGICYYWPTDNRFDSIIVLPGRSDAPTIGHEIYHHISMCMFSTGDNDHYHRHWRQIGRNLEIWSCHELINGFPEPLQEVDPDFDTGIIPCYGGEYEGRAFNLTREGPDRDR